MTDENAEKAQGTDLVPEKKQKTKHFLTLAKGVKRTKTLMKIAAGSGALILAGLVAVPLLGTVMLLSLAVGAVAFIATILYSLKMVKEKTGYNVDVMNFMKSAEAAVNNATNKDVNVQAKTSDPPPAPAGAKSEPAPERHKLWDLQGHVYMFAEEPSVADLLKVRGATVVTIAGVTALPNETPVKILHDPKKESIKIEILVGEARGKSGWVCRSCVVREDVVV